jgi:acetyltransferase-like isoleucine patch superfamily enzyme
VKKIKFLFIKLKSLLKLSSNKNISKDIFLGPNVQIFGLDNILIKEFCTIGESTLLTVNNRSNQDIQLTICTNVYIGRDNFISVGKSVYISDYCIFGNKCSLVCSDHIFESPLIPYGLSGNSYEKKIIIGVNCWFGHGVSVVGNVKIGHGSIIGANTLITKDIPPFSMVVGNPAKIIKTFNFETDEWEKELHENKSIYLNEEAYLKHLKTNNGNVHLAYHSASSRLGHL